MLHILRLGHRPERDKRITTHVCLTARAFGADKVIIAGARDPHLLESVKNVVNNWGGKFEIDCEHSWKNVLQRYKKEGWYIVHLTMYGDEFSKWIKKIQEEENKGRNILIIVGGEKVPTEVYEMSDLNLSVTFQPHSEVAALAVFLDHFTSHAMLNAEFSGSKVTIPHSIYGKLTKRYKNSEIHK